MIESDRSGVCDPQVGTLFMRGIFAHDRRFVVQEMRVTHPSRPPKQVVLKAPRPLAGPHSVSDRT